MSDTRTCGHQWRNNDFDCVECLELTIADLLAAAKGVSAMFPDDISDDGSGRLGFKPESIQAVARFRAAITKAETK